MIILFFLTLKPSINKAIFDLELSKEEQQKLNNPNEIIAEFTD